MSEWWKELELEDRSRDEEKAKPLVNALGKLPGARDQKLAFLVEHMALMEAEVARELAARGESDAKQFGRRMVSIAFRFWRNELRKRERAVVVAPSFAAPWPGENDPFPSFAERDQARIRSAVRSKYGDPHAERSGDRRDRHSPLRLLPEGHDAGDGPRVHGGVEGARPARRRAGGEADHPRPKDDE